MSHLEQTAVVGRSEYKTNTRIFVLEVGKAVFVAPGCSPDDIIIVCCFKTNLPIGAIIVENF